MKERAVCIDPIFSLENIMNLNFKKIVTDFKWIFTLRLMMHCKFIIIMVDHDRTLPTMLTV